MQLASNSVEFALVVEAFKKTPGEKRAQIKHEQDKQILSIVSSGMLAYHFFHLNDVQRSHFLNDLASGNYRATFSVPLDDAFNWIIKNPWKAQRVARRLNTCSSVEVTTRQPIVISH